MSGTCSTFITAMAIWRAVLERSGFTPRPSRPGQPGDPRWPGLEIN
jgi:hypothetical protein